VANHLYYVIVKMSEGPGRGRFELHNSADRKDVAIGRPDCMAKAIRYYDKGSHYVAIETIQRWRHEMKDRFGAVEIDPDRATWPA